MSRQSFIDVFLNPLLVDRIKYYLDYAPLDSFKLPSTYFIPASSIKELDYYEFYIYCSIKFGYGLIEDVLHIIKKKNIINTAVEENDMIMIKTISDIFSLEQLATYESNQFCDYRAILSSIKHKNIDILKYITETLNTIYDFQIYELTEYKSCYNALKFSCFIGNIDIMKYILFFMKPNIKFTEFHISDFILCIIECIRYNHTDCALYLLDYYKMYTKKTSLPVDFIKVSSYIRRRAREVHSALFYIIRYEPKIINWLFIEIQVNKLNNNMLKTLFRQYKNSLNLSEKEKALMIIKFISKLQRIISKESKIYVELSHNTGYYIKKLDIMETIIKSLFYYPLKNKVKSNMKIYKDLYRINRIIVNDEQ